MPYKKMMSLLSAVKLDVEKRPKFPNISSKRNIYPYLAIKMPEL